MQREGTLYTIIFTTLLCGICSVLVSGAAVGLKERQKANQVLDRQKKVLLVSGLVGAKDRLAREEVQARFKENITPKIVTLETGDYDDSVAIESFDQRKEASDPASSRPAPENNAGLKRVPNHALVYHLMKEGAVDGIVLPVQGSGLWSMLYGYLSLDKDTTTVRGIIFYEHGETPGLGGEIENPRWTALWAGRKAFDEQWAPALKVIKGPAGPPETDPHHIDGLSGATLTSKGVTNLVQFWLGDGGFGPYLEKLREQGS
jgi:Na+-transporting NADH:ubiquinone oxidoreductase subunit C